MATAEQASKSWETLALGQSTLFTTTNEVHELGGKRQRKKKKEKRSVFSLRPTVNVVLVCLIVVLYPIIVMPIYRSSSVTDGIRIIFVCFIHPLLHEAAMTIQRANAGKAFLLKKTVFDKNRFHFALASLMGPLIVDGSLILCESLFVIFRSHRHKKGQN